MPGEGVHRGLVLPKVEGLLLAGVDAVTGRPVQVEVDVQAALQRVLHTAVQLLQGRLVDLVDLVRHGGVQVAQGGHGHVAVVEPVQQAEAVRVDGVDGAGGDAHHPVVGLGGNVRGLVDHVEAQLAAGDALIALGKGFPVQLEGLQALGVPPKVEGLHPVLGHGIARRPVEAGANVDAVLLAPAHGLVHHLQLPLVDLKGVVVVDPEGVVQGQAHKVKAQLGDELKVLLLEGSR